MIIKQLSIDIENKAGSSWLVFNTLAESGINILSYSIADTADHGILRLIVDNINTATAVLHAKGFSTNQTDVFSLNCPNETGSMAKVLQRLAEKNVSINYMYAFQYMGISQAIIHAEDMDLLKKVLTEYERERLH